MLGRMECRFGSRVGIAFPSHAFSLVHDRNTYTRDLAATFGNMVYTVCFPGPAPG